MGDRKRNRTSFYQMKVGEAMMANELRTIVWNRNFDRLVRDGIIVTEKDNSMCAGTTKGTGAKQLASA